MTAQVISIVVLALIFVLATTRSTDMGALAFAGAFLVGTLAGGLDAFSTNGALVPANAKDVDRDRFFKQPMVYGAIVVATAPLLVWLLFVVPNLG